MTSGVLLTRARLWVASVLAVSIPVVLFAACREECDGCGECLAVPSPCVETCGGPVVVEVACEACPDGLIDGWQTSCGIDCDDPAPLQFCGGCPPGLYDLSVNKLVDCVELCDGPSVAQICPLTELCPPGSFDITYCEVPCASQQYVCLDHCGGEIFYVRCWPCSDGFVDRATCMADAGADGG